MFLFSSARLEDITDDLWKYLLFCFLFWLFFHVYISHRSTPPVIDLEASDIKNSSASQARYIKDEKHASSSIKSQFANQMLTQLVGGWKVGKSAELRNGGIVMTVYSFNAPEVLLLIFHPKRLCVCLLAGVKFHNPATTRKRNLSIGKLIWFKTSTIDALIKA